jgi:pyridoxamine 5'-phosphate oxidase
MTTIKDCADFANANTTCYLATCDGDQPHVRAMGMWFADETGFYFQSQTVKALYKQLEKNPRVELSFTDGNTVLRVTGKSKFVTDEAILIRCIEERPIVKKIGITEPSNPLLAVFHVYTGEAFFWTFADSMKEASLPRIKF